MIQPKLPNSGMKDGFEFFASHWICEDTPSKLIATKAAVGPNQVSPEGIANFGKGRLAGLDESAGEKVSIDDRHAALGEQRSRGGLSHPDAAGKT